MRFLFTVSLSLLINASVVFLTQSADYYPTSTQAIPPCSGRHCSAYKAWYRKHCHGEHSGCLIYEDWTKIIGNG
jgi:hypothetical protein